jgi:hypothetical protein
LKFDDSANRNVIGPGNIIAYNGLGEGSDGIYATGTGTNQNIFTQNRIFANLGNGIDLVLGANNSIARPVITGEETGSIVFSGTACTGCLVELFGNPLGEDEGRYYLDSTTANASGNFSFTFSIMSYPDLTATATDPEDGTSEFSEVFTSQFRVVFLPLIKK